MARAASGSVIVAQAGITTDAFAVSRYDAYGRLDPTFGQGGIAEAPRSEFGMIPFAVSIQANGEIVAVGSGGTPTGGRIGVAIARWDTQGMLDSTFGKGGVAVTQVSTGIDMAYALAVQKDGHIVVAGEAQFGDRSRFAVIRYLPK